MRIGIGNDHAAVELKNVIAKHLEDQGYEVVNFGTDTCESCNYPELGEAVANAVASGEVDRGITICGTGVGIGIAANKVEGIRCCICSEPYSALMARRHNDANMLALGARVVGTELAKMIVDAWMGAEFEGGRHQTRVELIAAIERHQHRGE